MGHIGYPYILEKLYLPAFFSVSIPKVHIIGYFFQIINTKNFKSGHFINTEPVQDQVSDFQRSVMSSFWVIKKYNETLHIFIDLDFECAFW